MKIGDTIEIINQSIYASVKIGEKYKSMSLNKIKDNLIEIAGVKGCNSNGGYFIQKQHLKLIRKQIIQIY